MFITKSPRTKSQYHTITFQRSTAIRVLTHKP
jgi:hypothetical protein